MRLLLAALALSVCAAAPRPPEPRAQRSANLSHITGTGRDIQMFLKNRYLQLLPDGSVNGTTDGGSVYTILRRATYKVGLLTVQGVSTCLYLCMDACGFHYGHKDLSDDCMFDEHMEENNYNTYSRVRAGKRTYLALDTRGRARRTQLPAARPLGNLSVYALALTTRAAAERHPPAQCPARRHRGKLKRPPPFHRNCQARVQKQLQRMRRRKPAPKKRTRHPKTRRKLDRSTTTTEPWDDATSTTDEFFRATTARESAA